ncbi:MAG: DNA-processing protein DprA [Thermotogota bacterium]|nr:DNA-processing protein DprA [Thermotogota bacterium]
MNRNEKIAVAAKLALNFNDLKKLFENYDSLRVLGNDSLRLPFKVDIQEIVSVIERLEKCHTRKDLRIITYEDEDYPPILREINDPPWCLFVKGKVDVLNMDLMKFAVVGSRKNTHYGKLTVDMIVPLLVEKGICIVSGLAFGIDSLSHKKALEYNGKVIGVLGCGVDIVYPKSNEGLYKKVIQNGCIISEYLPWERPRTYYFPRRNRIISGLSRGVLVVEAAKKSGSLITARCALEQNRDVFAIPGQINAYSSGGTNDLIKKGAKLVTCTEDIFEEYPDSFSPLQNEELQETLEKRAVQDMNDEERLVFGLIKEGVSDFDTLTDRSQLDTSSLNYTLTLLTLKGVIDVVGTSYQKRV